MNYVDRDALSRPRSQKPAIATFTVELLEEKFGPNFEKQRPDRINLSGPEYALEDLEAPALPRSDSA